MYQSRDTRLIYFFLNQIVNLLQAKYKRDYGGLHHSLIDKRLEAIRKE